MSLQLPSLSHSYILPFARTLVVSPSFGGGNVRIVPFGSIICRQLLGLEKPADGSTLPPKRPCSEFVAFGAELAENMIFTA